VKNLTKKAFTMVELIFVVVVLGILTSIALPKFAATQNEAAEANIKQQIQAIRASIESEKMERLQKAKSMQNNDSDGNLTLYYNYRPWEGQKYTDGNHSVIMQDVDTFQYKAVGDLIKVQMCVKDGNISSDGGYSICKEKTIF
jgi:prepilin-type N-terminal cleavage/methylation domain-containing protein